MIEYPKVLYRPSASAGLDVADAALESTTVNSLEEEKKANRAGWMEWHSAFNKSGALLRRGERIASVRRFFEQWKWAFEAFVVVAGAVAAVVAYFAAR